ncbi:gp7 baseplate wedge initiator [Acinetobacter phage Ac42]|uniref:baseplate wedge subunit n=1 Tax=Acinetobacter phage Ac42 TaxID=762660 RepID=UPI0001EBCD7B|nr:baseplate wedge subunit [Acinetobacter phage Ac42]ADI96402.1 gp7 baseplate wedge initiator [Acinetobacter phage Ac42]
MIVKAPYVTSLEISKLSANHVEITWDDVGSNFFYFVEITETRNDIGIQWVNLGYTADRKYFFSDLDPDTYYKMRVAVAAEGFEQSDWMETEEFQSFTENAYTFELMTEMSLISKFISEKFTKNNQSYVDFNKDVIMASLVNEEFQFSPNYEHISSMSNFIIKENEYHEIQGSIEKVCTDINRVYLMESNDVLYLFERYQPIVKVSNDKGQTWKAVKLLNDRVGYPISPTVFSQTASTSYVLGYDRIFYGRQSTDIRWSADDVRFSSQDITFAKIGDQLNLGFDVELFGTYARLPGDMSTIAESIVATEEFIYVVARDKVRYVKVRNAPTDTDPLSPTFGEKVFEPDSMNITGNPKAVCYKLETVNGKVFALITGEVKVAGQDPRNTANIVDSNLKGVYRLEDDNTWTRTYGNTTEERRRIEHGYSSISSNGNEVFFSSSNYRLNQDQMIDDPELVSKYPDEVSSAVKVAMDNNWVHDKHYMMMSFRANANDDFREFKPGRMQYYAEPFFSVCRKSNTRCWINNSRDVVVVYTSVEHTQTIEPYPETSPNRFVHEVWDGGECTVIFPNIDFKNFTRYASGVIFYKASGELISYYEFNYRVKDEVRIVWKPTNVFLKAYLQQQTREEPWVPDESDWRRDPDLQPLITTMIPDSYLLEGSNFEKFSQYYLQYISDGYGTSYNNLLNLIRNKYPREKNSWEYLWSEIYKRNIYLNREKRDLVSRFFQTRKADFYSTKGIEESYKFLFKVLYNEEVEIDIESNSGTEYDVIIESDLINDDLAGQTIYTPSGRCNVTYVERHYNDGKLQWRVTIHNLIGRLMVGQEVKAERSSMTGTIIQGVRGKDLASNTIEYINRNRSYYVMRIKSTLPTSRYRDDVLRFVHPVGFGFVGITLLTMFMNAGLSMKHTETIINKLKNYRWDAGLPSVWPDRVAILTANDVISMDPVTGEPVYALHPNAGQPFIIPPTYNSENNNTIISGQNPDQRRRPMSPTFDQSAVTFASYRALVDQRLKDDIGLPRDPTEPTQVKINE